MANVQGSADTLNGTGDRVIAFLFTDIEGSTGHAQRFPEGMRSAHARHDGIIRKAAETFGGDLFAFVGDGFKAAFDDPAAAVRAAFEAQRTLQTVFMDDKGTILLRVRMAIHAGITQEREGEYVGLTPAKASRLLETIHGGQIVITEGAAELVRTSLPNGVTLQDIGEHQLRDFETPDRLFQIAHPDLPANFSPLRPTDAVPNNLPNQFSHLIGRETETEEIRQRVITHPLVTLTGAGGCGKTRLAIHVADRFLRKFPKGVWFIDLTHSGDEAAIAQTTADVLGIKPDADSPLTRQIIAHLAPLRCLLILDNCEHIIDAAAHFAAELLKSCKDVRILATSREALGINGEALYPVHPLPFPPEDIRDPKMLMTFDSVRLFALQARLKSPTFTLTNENVFAVARICRTLEGIPLGVCLMASWADALTPEQLDEQMAKRFKFPRAAPGERTLPDRHLTLRSAIEYSLDLLTESERALLRRLSIFSGGFTLDAAEAVCDATPLDDVLESLTLLLRKSLIETEDTPFGKRYRLLQIIREYALEILKECGEHDGLRIRHRNYFIQWAMEIEPRLFSSDSRRAMEQVDADIDNLRSAINAAGNVANGLRLFSALAWYWYMRGYTVEGIQYGEHFLTLDQTSPIADIELRATARNRHGILYQAAKNVKAARLRFSEALVIFRERTDREKIAKCLSNLGGLSFDLKDYRKALSEFEEAHLLYTDLQDFANEAIVRANIGITLVNLGQPEEGIEHLSLALQFQRRANNSSAAAFILLNLAVAATMLKRWREAFVYLRDCLDIRREENHRWGIAACFDSFAAIADGVGDSYSALRFIGFAEALRDGSDVLPLTHREEIAALRQRAQSALSKEIFSAEEAAGRKMKLEEIISELDAFELNLHSR